jgi:hypothetical protein
MNAYELANNLENKDRLWAVDENLMLNTCEMLRQQADRIAELSKNVDELQLQTLLIPMKAGLNLLEQY